MFKIIICVHFKNAHSRMFVEWNFLIIYNCTQFSIKKLRMFYNEKVENIFVKSFHVLRKIMSEWTKFLKKLFLLLFSCPKRILRERDEGKVKKQ